MVVFLLLNFYFHRSRPGHFDRIHRMNRINMKAFILFILSDGD